MEYGNRKRTGIVWEKALIFLLFLTLLACLSPIFMHRSRFPAQASGSSYAVFNVADETCLYGVNENARLPMASTTKIMTALVALENSNLDEKVAITDSMCGIEGSSVYLRKGEILSVRDLLYCMMLRSGNDSAVALATHVGGSVDAFVAMMNERAASLGLSDTHFVNPHGLHDDQHYTSAHDLGIISCVAMRNPVFRDIVSTKRKRVGEKDSVRDLINKNKMLTLYEDAVGVKTGYTKRSGRCLVSAAEKNGTTLVCVVLNEPDTYGVSIALLDRGFVLA